MRVKYILFTVLCIAFSVAQAGKGFTIKTIVIDAGHGGKDPGATGPGHTNEKDVALAVALKLGEEIQKSYPDIKVIYTRKTDVFIELHERADIANKNKADLFIAIHCNSSPNGDAYGTSTYVLGLHRTEANLEVAKRENSVILLEADRDKNYEFDPNTPEGHIIMSMKQNAFLDQSIDIASKIENELENNARRKSLGVKQAGFYVLYKTTMPSLLAEIGFISNPDEEKYLVSTKGQDMISTSLFTAFKAYKAEVEDSKPVGAVQEDKTVVKSETKTEIKQEPAAVVSNTSGTTASNSSSTKSNQGSGSNYTSVLMYDSATVTLKNGKVIKKPVENTSGGGKAVVATAEPPAPVKKEPVKPEPVVVKTEPAPVIVKKDTPVVVPVPVVETKVEVKTPPVVVEHKDTPVVVPPKKEEVPVVVKKEEKPVVVQKEEKPVVAQKEEKKETVIAPPVTPVKVEEKPVKPVVTEVKTVKTEVKTETKVTEPEVKVVKPQPKVVEPKAEVKAVNAGPTTFKVQLYALKEEIKEGERAKINRLFKEHSDEKIPSGLTRYYAGNTSSYTEAKKVLAAALANGYSGAFIVGLKDGRRMGADEMKALDNH